MEKNKRQSVYVSHSIRGVFGNDATPEQMQDNCNISIEFGKALKKEFPNIDFYIPADHDEWIALAYQKKYIIDTQILDIDCDILSKRDCLLVYSPDDYISGGMQIEIDFAKNNEIPTFFYYGDEDIDYAIWNVLRNFFRDGLK